MNNAGRAKKMLTANNNLAKARKTNGETVLQVLARNPSAFVSETRPCEFFIYFSWLEIAVSNKLYYCDVKYVYWFTVSNKLIIFEYGQLFVYISCSCKLYTFVLFIM